MRSLVTALLCVLIELSAGAAQAATASIDRNRLSENETLELRIRVDNASGAAPELSPLQKDFEVLSNSRNSRISLINGRGESYTEWVIALAPRHSGEIVIPPIKVDGEQTDPIEVLVSAADDATSTTGTKDISLEVLPDASEVHVQQQLLVTVRLLHAIDLANGATLEEPSIDGAVVRKIGEGSYEKRIGGRMYGVFERRYAVFPQTSGELLIPRLQFDATVGSGSWFDQFGGNGRRVRERSREQRIRVLAPEQGATPWLPARLLTLVETWDRSPQELKVGESATRTLTLSADGLTGAQLPSLAATNVDGLRIYPDKPDINDETADDGIRGTRIERSAVIPTRNGEIRLPELRVRWWDTTHARFEEAVVPARSIVVQGEALQPAAPTPPIAVPSSPAKADTANPEPATGTVVLQDTRALRIWQSASGVLALLLVFSVIQWRRAVAGRRAGTAEPEGGAGRERDRFNALCAACRSNDAIRVPDLLLDWSRVVLPAPAPRSLAELPGRFASPALRSAIDALQRSRFSREAAAWHGDGLLAVIEDLRARHRPAARDNPALPPLYPQDRARGAA